MSQEINFYQVDETIIKALAPLLIKILDEKKQVLVFSDDANQLKEIDASLWSYGRNKFIPHVMSSDKEFELARQPIVITSETKNPNNADYLVFLSDIDSDFVKGFSRVFYFFEERHLEEAKKMAKKFKPTKSYKKTDGKWVKI